VKILKKIQTKKREKKKRRKANWGLSMGASRKEEGELKKVIVVGGKENGKNKTTKHQEKNKRTRRER